jgi:hypothetical protein
MNAWQFAQQIQHELQSVTWADGSVVFGDAVHLYAGPVNEGAIPPSFPFALVTIGAATPDPDEPELWEHEFSVATAVMVEGDPYGSHAIIGGPRPQLTASAGAGVLEVSERVRSALQDLTAYDGAPIIVSSTGIDAPGNVGNSRHVVFDGFRCSALCTSQPFHHAPQQLTLTGGVASWEGEWCARRFDFLQYRFGYVAGTTAVATPEELDTIVYTGSAEEVAFTRDYPRVYQVFADYDPRGTGSPAASSAAIAGTWVAI